MEPHRVGPPAPGVEEFEVDGSVSLYHPTLDQALVLNQTASDVWRLCDGEHTPDDIVALLALAYGVDEGEIRSEVLATVQQFEDQKLL